MQITHLLSAIDTHAFFLQNKVTKFRMYTFSKAFTFCTTNSEKLDCIISEGCDNSNYFVFPSGAR